MYLHCKLFKHIFMENKERMLFFLIPEAEKLSV